MMHQFSFFKRFLSLALSALLTLVFCLAPALATSDKTPKAAPITKTVADPASKHETSPTAEIAPAQAHDSDPKIYSVDNGDTIDEVIANLHEHDYESIVGFSSDGEKLFDYTSYLPDSARITEADAKKLSSNKGSIVIHNHPDETSFSGKDILAAIKWDVSRMIVVAQSNVFVLSPPACGWGDPEIVYNYQQERVNQRLQELRSIVCGYYPRTAAEIIADPERPDDGSASWYYETEVRRQCTDTSFSIVTICYADWATHRAAIDVAGRFGYLYQRIPLDDFNSTDFSL